MNILFLHSHNTGTFVQPYGHAVPTPNLQKLAEEGVLFRKAFAAAPTCSPSRASFLTGMVPHSAGQFGLAHRGFPMADYDRHITRVLKRHGYTTALSGVEHTAPDVKTVGYDYILSGNDTNYAGHEKEPDTADAAAAFLDDVGDTPFFLSVGLNETHRPFPKAEPSQYPAEDDRYTLPPSPLPDVPELRSEAADFRAAARAMDEAWGKVLGALDRNDLSDRTLVFCFADHGLQFARNMCNLTDQGTRVYCVARGPGGFQGGKVVDALVSLIDLAPTAYDLAGIAIPEYVEGVSLKPLVNGEIDTLHDAVFSEVNYHAAYEPMRSIRTDRFKYIRRFDGRPSWVLPNVDDTESKAFLLAEDWEAQPRDPEMLFDLVFDPHEANNLSGSAAHADLETEMRSRLDTWMRESGDPLLVGDVPAPPGARVNPPDGQSPREPTQPAS